MPPAEIAELREKIRRRAFLVRERAKLMTKIRSVLAYEGLKPPKESMACLLGRVLSGFKA